MFYIYIWRKIQSGFSLVKNLYYLSFQLTMIGVFFSRVFPRRWLKKLHFWAIKKPTLLHETKKTLFCITSPHRREKCGYISIVWIGKNNIVWFSIFMEQLCGMIVPWNVFKPRLSFFFTKPMQLAQTNWYETERKKILCVCCAYALWLRYYR